MLRTYRAILTGTHIEWVGYPPLETGTDKPVDVEIKVLDVSKFTKASVRSLHMAKALEKLSKVQTLSDIDDPVKWQREIRQDRILPGRSD